MNGSTEILTSSKIIGDLRLERQETLSEDKIANITPWLILNAVFASFGARVEDYFKEILSVTSYLSANMPFAFKQIITELQKVDPRLAQEITAAMAASQLEYEN